MPDEAIQRIDLQRPATPPSDSKISTADALTEPIGVHFVDGDQTVLFGTGYDETADALLDALPAAPDVVVVEHGDPDHYGAVPSLRAAFEDLTVVAPLGDRDAMAEVVVDAFLEDGDAVAGFEAVHVPGHTPGNTSFVDEQRGVLVAGDSFVTADSEIAAAGEWTGAFAPLERRYCSDFDELVESLPVLADYAFDTALLTHGADRVGDAGRAVDTLLADLEQNC